MSPIIDLSQPIETGQPVYPGLAKTLINTWNTYEETARVQGQGKMDRLYTTCSVFFSDPCSTPIEVLVHFGHRPRTAEKIPLENLTHIDQLVGRRFRFAGFPLKLVSASGAPLRAVAVLEE